MSVTYIGVIVGFLGWLLKQAGVEFETEALTNFVTTGLAIVGALLALFGRWRNGGITWYGAKK